MIDVDYNLEILVYNWPQVSLYYNFYKVENQNFIKFLYFMKSLNNCNFIKLTFIKVAL